MFRQYAASSLFGILMKLIDDIEDVDTFKPYFNDLIIEIIKSLIIVTYTYVCVNNINFAFLTLIFHLLFHIQDPKCLDNNFFIAGTIITIIICIFFFSSDNFNMQAILISMFIGIIPAYIDHKLFPEDFSIKKIIGRFNVCILALILLGLTIFYNQKYMIKEMLFVGIFYSFTSVFTMSTQFTKDQIDKINTTRIFNIVKYVINLFKEETEKKINEIIEKIEKEEAKTVSEEAKTVSEEAKIVSEEAKIVSEEAKIVPVIMTGSE